MKFDSSSDRPDPGPDRRDLLGKIVRGEFSSDLLADAVVRDHGASREAVLRCLAEYRELARHGGRLRFGDLLIERRLLAPEAYRDLLRREGMEIRQCVACGLRVEARLEEARCPSCAGELRAGDPESEGGVMHSLTLERLFQRGEKVVKRCLHSPCCGGFEAIFFSCVSLPEAAQASSLGSIAANPLLDLTSGARSRHEAQTQGQ